MPKKKKVDFLLLSDVDSKALDQGMILTREYQVTLNRTLLRGRRNETLPAVLKIIGDALHLPQISLMSMGEETVRFQYLLDTAVCGKSYNPRGRDYFFGHRANTSTLDIKSRAAPDESPQQIVDKDWTIFPPYKQASTTKFEWDVHPCKIKYSVESRMAVPFKSRLQTCEDLTKIFGRLKTAISPASYSKKLSLDTMFSGWWYELEHNGLLSDGVTKFKSSVTINYPTAGDAKTGLGRLPINISEWSLRIWSSSAGLGAFSRRAVETTDQNYQNLLAALQSPDLPCTQEDVAF